MRSCKWTWAACGYTLASAGASYELIGKICSTAGFSGFEGAPPLFADRSDRDLPALREEFGRGGVSINSFHLPFSPEEDPTAFYETRRRTAVDTLRTWMQRAALLGSKIAVIHPCTVRYDTEVEGLDHYRRQLGKTMDELLPLAEKLDLKLAVENMLPTGGKRFGSQPEHMKLMQSDFSSSHFGFCLDTGHALISGGPEHAHELFDAMAPRLVAFHLSDTPGDRDIHIAPGRGLVDWRRVFGAMVDMGFEGAACVETPPFAYGPEYSLQAWGQLVRDMDELFAMSL